MVFLRVEGLSSDKIELAVTSILNSQRSFTKKFNDMVILAVAEKCTSLASYDKGLRQKAKEMGIDIIP